MHFSILPCTAHIFYAPWFDNPNNICWRVQIYEAPHYAIFTSLLLTSFLLGPNDPLSTLFSNTLNLCSSH
jgi:hypothetical protein